MESTLNDLVVIVGVGRSGTSLLQSMLGSHSAIYSIPETSFFRRNVCSFKNTLRREYSEAEMASVLNSDTRLPRLNVNIEDIFPEKNQLKESRSISYLEVYQNILSYKRKVNGARLVCDKDPKLIEFLPVLKVIEGCKVVLIIRDPRDILLSKKNAEWSKNRPVLLTILIGFIQMKLASSYIALEKDSSPHIVIYEHLLKDTGSVLNALTNFLDLDYEPGMLEFGAHSKDLVSADEYSWKKETLGPLLRENVNKWDGELAVWEIAVIEKLRGDSFKLGGYKSSNAYLKLNIISRLMVVSFCASVKCLSPILIRFHKLRSYWLLKNLLR